MSQFSLFKIGQVGDTATAFSLNEEFAPVLRQQLAFFNHDPSSDRISQVKNELADVKDVMVQSIERVMERGERIELLVDKTDRLNQTSFKFEKSSKQLKNVTTPCPRFFHENNLTTSLL